MKQEKNFLVLIFLVLFFSCINETPIEGEGDGNPASDETTLTIQLPIEGILTKGLDPKTGLYATAKELEINNCMIAIFDSKGVLAGYKRVVKGDEDLAGPEDKKVYVGDDPEEPEGNSKNYTITNITTRHGKGMTILVIANSESARTVSTDNPNQLPVKIGVTTLEAYEALYETTLPFVDERLVKVGLLTDQFIEAKKGQRIEVALTQLSARIDLSIALGEELVRGGWSYSINSLKKYNQRYLSYLLYPEKTTSYTEISDSPVTVLYETEDGKRDFHKNGHTFYTYQKKWYSADDLAGENDVLYVDVNLDLIKGDVSENKIYRFQVNPKGLGPQKDRNGLLAGNLYEVKAKLNSISFPSDFTLEYEAIGWWGGGEPIPVKVPDFI